MLGVAPRCTIRFGQKARGANKPMARLFGVAAVQMEVVPWDAGATVQKMIDIIGRVSETLPWVQMFVFHELVVSGVAQLVGRQTSESWKDIAEKIPGPLSDELCE